MEIYLKRVLLFFILNICFICYINAQVNLKTDSVTSEPSYRFPNSVGCVNDFENILSEKQERELSKIIRKYERTTSNEVVIVTIGSISPYESMADFTTDLSNQWAVGKVDKNNGLVIVFSSGLREVRVGTGFGTEKILTDSICKEVIDEEMIQEFKNGNYFIGLKKGLVEFIDRWK